MQDEEKIISIIQQCKETQSTQIDLSGLEIEQLPDDFFTLTHLKKIILTTNKLHTLSKKWGAFSQLETLDLSTNQFLLFPEILCHLKTLEHLDLSDNKIMALSTQIKHLHELKSFNFHTNRLSSICSQIGELKQLHFLSFSINNLTSLPRELSYLKNLKILSLNKNKLTELPEWICHLKKLLRLNLNRTDLTEISFDIQKLNHLESLNLGNTSISELSFYHPKEKSKILSMKAYGIKPNDTTVVIEQKAIDTIPSFIWEMPHLRHLKITYTNITEIPNDIEKLPQLLSLMVCNNRITRISPKIGMCQQLKALRFGNNAMTELPKEIYTLQNLRTLKCSNNHLSFIDNALFDLPHLKIVSLAGNRLSFPPQKIASRGLMDIRIFLKAQQSGTALVPIQQVKIACVGKGGVGKTSLIKSLIEDTFDTESLPTKGIDVSTWNYHDKEHICKHKIWDFSGQEIQFKTHQFYLSKNAIFILVWEDRQFDPSTNILYWLHTIAYFSEYASVFVIQNKCDISKSVINSKELKETFPNILEFHTLSCKTKEGLSAFKKSLQKTLSEHPYANALWPVEWVNLKNTLQHYPALFIGQKEWNTLCNEHHIQPEFREILQTLFHEQGHILCIPKRGYLNNYILLYPQFMAQVTHAILESPQIRKKDGFFTQSDLLSILNTFGKPDYLEPVLIFLISFSFCSQLKENIFLIPSLLPFWTQQDDTKEKPNIIYHLKYTHLIADPVSHFIAQHSQLIDRRYLYQNFLRFSYGSSTVQLHLNSIKKTLTISIFGSQYLETFRMLKHEFETIHIIKGINDADEFIQCPCRACSYSTPHYFHLDTLMKYLAHNKTIIVCPHSMEDVSLSFISQEKGKPSIQYQAMEKLIEQFSKQYKLSKQEETITRKLMTGMSNQHIAHNLYISLSTVKNHIQSIFRKTGIAKRSQILHTILKTSGDIEDR